MKSLFSFFILLLSIMRLSAQTAAPAPIFLLFTQDCMDQLEYRYTYSGTGVLTYSVHPNSNEQFLLKAGSEGITSPTLPKGAVTCRGFTMNAAFTDAINQMKRQVYVVHQTPSGYLQMPIIEATQVTRNGAFYLFKSPNYAFALDSTKLVGAVNLATSNSISYVYLTGVTTRGCRREYSFRREPIQAGMERADFDFIPGIGFTSDRSGLTAADAEGNSRRLVKMNGMAFDDYVAATCKGQYVAASTLPVYAPEFGYGSNTPNTAFNEPRKEEYSSASNPVVPVGPPPPGLITCPELPGYGYHIVQPKETLAAISRTYKVDMKTVQRWNGIKDANHIEICQKIWVTKPPINTVVTKSVAPDIKTKIEEGILVYNQSVYWNQPATVAPQTVSPANYSTSPAITYSGVPASATAKSGTAPAQYGPSLTTPNSTPYYFSAPTAPVATTARPSAHFVEKGESVYSISKRFGCPEECIRMANNMPAQGNIVLQINQQIIIPDCNCQTSGVQNSSILSNPVNTGNLLSPSTMPAPVTYSTPGNPDPTYINPTERFSETSVVGNQQQKGATTAAQPGTTAAYFQEYVVRQGDTMGSIAARFKVSSAELVQVNSLEVNETLMPGKRLLIPRTN